MTIAHHRLGTRLSCRAGTCPRQKCIVALAAAILACGIAHARPFEMGPEFSTVTTEIETPHVKWAKPLAGGPLKLLVVAPRFAHRETAELMQRLDAECDVVMTQSHEALGASSEVMGFREFEVLAALEERLAKPHDVIIIGSLSWAILPKPLQYEILRQASEGTGLLLSQYQDAIPEIIPKLFAAVPAPKLLAEGLPWGGLPSLMAGPGEDKSLVRFAGELKQGRCMVLRWPAGPGWFHYITAEPVTQLEYDYNMSVTARALLWLAKREPQGELAIAIKPRDDGRAEVTLTGTGALEFEVRDRFGEVVYRNSRPESGRLFQAQLIGLKAGKHFVNAWLRESQGGTTTTWASAWFDMPATNTLAEAKTDKKSYAPGETVTVSVKLSKPAARWTELLVSATDTHGRNWARVQGEIEEGKTEASISFPADGMLSPHSSLTVDLMGIRGVFDQARVDLYVPLRSRRDFSVGVWGGGGDSWLSKQRWALDRRLGVDTTIFNGDITQGIRPTPYASTQFRHGGKGDVRQPCLTDPKFWEEEAERLTSTAESLAKADVFAYSLGDEICLDVGNSDLCRSATCLAGLRDWLKERHGSLAALNAVWGTEFTAWEAVAPKTRSEAEQAGNLAPWFEHRLFMDTVFGDGLAKARDIIHQTDPRVPVGAEGMWGSTSAYGMDWWPMARDLGFLVPYWDARLCVESTRSFHRPGTITGTWFGNYGEDGVDEAKLRWLPWNALMHQYNSIWWYAEYRGLHFGATPTGLAPDYRPTCGFAAAMEETALIRRGFDALLLNGKRAHDGVAVLYSRPGIHVWGNKYDDLLDALEEIGLQYGVVPVEGLSASALQDEGYRALVLPGVCVLSDEQAEQIREFVSNGGAALAQLPPGIYDPHGRVREASVLADVFGVSAMGTETLGESRQVTPKNGDTFAVSECTTSPAADTARVTASFADGNAAATVNEFGQGQACLLAFSLEGFAKSRVRGDEDLPVREFLARTLGDLDIRPAVRVAGDRPVRGLEIARFEYPDAECIVLSLEPLGELRDRDSSAQALTLKFADSRITINARTGAELGDTNQVTLSLKPGDTAIVARLRAARPLPEVTVSPAAVRPGGTVLVSVARDLPGTPLHVEVNQPGGAVAGWWTRNIVTLSEPVSCELRMALDAPAGRYTVTVRDLLTGQAATANFEVPGG